MEKLDMHTKDFASVYFDRLAQLFPECVTEVLGVEGEARKVIDFEKLKQILATEVIDGPAERYQFTWPDKKKAIRAACSPILSTLRPIRNESLDFDNTKNLYIEGDNLDVLKLLREDYLGKIKVVYIDPPYNTGNDFIYNDDFSTERNDYVAHSGQIDDVGNRLVQNTESNGRFHTDWLNMMYPRLKVARDLLTDDGVIFISIDENELDNILKLGYEIYGRDNYIGTLSVENNPKGRKNSSFISVSSEFCVIFAKNKPLSYFIENVPKSASDMTLDEDGRYVHNSGKRVLVGENSFNNRIKKVESDKNYSVYYRKKDNSLVIKKEAYGEDDASLRSSGYKKYYSHYNGYLIENTYTEDKFRQLFEERALEFSDSKIYEKNLSDTIRIKSQLVNKKYEAIVRGKKEMYSMELTTTGAGTRLKSLFNTTESLFPAPKNTGFLKLLFSLFPKEPFIVLDFFSGSASSADAVMQLNSEDGGNRSFIMVQLNETTEKDSLAYKLGYKDICAIGKERIRLAGKSISNDQVDSAFDGGLFSQTEPKPNVDVGFRVLKLDSSNMQDVYYRPEESDETTLFEDNIKPDRTPEDLLFQIMLECNLPLSAKIESMKIAGKDVFSVNNGFLIACFDTEVNEEVIKAVAKMKPYFFVMRDSSLSSDNVADNFDQIFQAYSKETIRRVL